MQTLRRLLAWVITLVVVFYLLWIVVANSTPLSLNLLFVRTPELNAGLVVLMTLLIGIVTGLLLSDLNRRIRQWLR